MLMSSLSSFHPDARRCRRRRHLKHLGGSSISGAARVQFAKGCLPVSQECARRTYLRLVDVVRGRQEQLE